MLCGTHSIGLLRFVDFGLQDRAKARPEDSLSKFQERPLLDKDHPNLNPQTKIPWNIPYNYLIPLRVFDSPRQTLNSLTLGPLNPWTNSGVVRLVGGFWLTKTHV